MLGLGDKMELLEDYTAASAYEYYKGRYEDEKITKLIDEYGSDQELIEHELNENYPEKEYFILLDYNEEGEYFRIRVWKK